jgi:geranylgeranyl reductase family protein
MAGAVTEVDVLVVGAGPGGSSTAYHLARHGLDVLLVEKAAFPREKVCGDGLTPRGVAAIQRMGIDVEDPAFERSLGLRIYSRRTTLELRWPDLHDFPPFGLVMTRNELDERLARRAEKAGAILRERTEALGAVVDADGWVTGARIRTDDGPEETVRARFVVASDGAASRFATPLGVRRDDARPLGIAARRYYRVDRQPGPWFESWLDLWDGDKLMPGYGWLFPLADGTVNLGAGILNTFANFRSLSAQRILDAFAAMLPEEWGFSEDTAQGRTLSGPLPMGMNRVPAALPGLLLVGDAAGVVNPWNGEGIAYAIETGEIAADLLHESIAKDRPALAHTYPTRLRETYGRYFTLGRVFVRLIGNPTVMRTLTEYGLPREWLMRFALRTMGNLTDGPKGDLEDKLLYALERLAPAR